jgi:hypothetical protein
LECFDVAIAFAKLVPVHLAEHGGAVSAIAYLARDIVHDPRFEQPFDYSHLRADLAHEEIILPLDCPVTFLDRETLAIALDGAELRKIRTPLSQRNRQPQVGLALVVALPPSTEVSVDEAAEIFRRIVLAARGSEPTPIHLAIHEARINRHGHALFALRPVHRDGLLGLKLRDFIVRLRHTGSGNYKADVVEGIHWPSLTWEIHQTFFHELGIDLVVDPIAPEPGKHFSPVVFSSGKIDNSETVEQIASSRVKAHADNVRAIEGSPTRLVETLLRGRSSLPIAELPRLCAKFFDGETHQDERVDRILTDQNIITLTDPARAKGPRYATTRRMLRLLTRAAGLIDLPSGSRIKTFTEADEGSVLAQISQRCNAEGSYEKPLILGMKLSDCDAASTELAAYNPVVGTLDMVVTGALDIRAGGPKRDLCLRPGRPVIVPHAELIDDRRLARLMIATNSVGAELILGHDQSSQTGVVCRHLAAYAADKQRAETGAPTAEDRGSFTAVRLLRAGLVQNALNEIASRGSLEFGSMPNHAGDASLFTVCDDPGQVDDLCRTIRRDRVQAGSIGKPVPVTALGKELEFSVDEWIVMTKPTDSNSAKAEFARILAVDPINAAIEVVGSGEKRRIDLRSGPAVRPAALLSIREARNLFADAKVAVRATDPRRLWSALLLTAMLGQNARLHVDPKLARNKNELVEVARLSLPGALPHHRAVRRDPDAQAGKILLDIRNSFEFLPDTTPVEIKPPRPINATQDVRRLLAYDSDARDGYKLLYNYVAPHNPDHIENTTRALGLYRNELTRTVIRFLAGIERTSRRDPHAALDFPRELDELEPERWNYLEVYWLRTDLRCLTIPGRDCPINPASSFAARRLSRANNGLKPSAT